MAVYQLRCIDTDDRFLGKTADIDLTEQNTLSLLRRQAHRNIKLQELYNQYGPGSFVFSVLNGDNRTYMAYKNDIQPTLNAYGRGSYKRKKKTVIGLDILTEKEVYRFDRVADAARALNVDATGIHHCLAGRQATAYGCIWRYV